MKKLYQPLFLTVISIFLLYACSQENKTNHLKVIPANTAFVVNIQAKQIYKKAGLDKPEQYHLWQKLTAENKNEILSKYLEDPKVTGLKTDNFYVFGIFSEPETKKDSSTQTTQDSIMEEYAFMPVNTPHREVGISFQIDSESNFETFLTEIWKDKYNSLPIEDKTNYKIIKDNDVNVLWNKEVCLVIGNPLQDFDYGQYFTLTEEQSILSVADFQTFQKQQADIAVWGAYDNFLNYVMPMLGSNNPFPLAYLGDLKGLYFHAYADFKDDEIKISGRMSPSAKVEEYLAKYPIVKKDFNQSILGDFPKKSYFTYKLSLNIAEYIKVLQTAMATNKDDYTARTFTEILEDPNAKIILNALGGDALLNIYDFARGGLPIPLAGLSFTVKSEDDFRALMTLIPEGITRRENYFTIPVGGLVSIYFAYKDNKVYVTNDAEGISNFLGKGFETKLSNSDFSGDLKTAPYFFYVDLDIENYPENIKNYLLQLGEKNVSELKIYQDLTIKVTEKNEVECSLKFKGGKENSLKQLFTCIDNVINNN